MDRDEFINRLRELLNDIPEKEREDALAYYRAYFDDAGEENLDKTLEELGTPEKVAEMIKSEASDPISVVKERENEIILSDIDKAKTDAYGQYTQNIYAQPVTPKKRFPAWAIVLITIACVILSPAIIGIFFALVGILIAVVAVIFSAAVALAATFVSLAFVAGVLFIAGGSILFSSPFAGIVLIGASLLLAGICLLMLILSVLMFGKAIPAFFRWLGSLFKKHKNRKAEGIQ